MVTDKDRSKASAEDATDSQIGTPEPDSRNGTPEPDLRNATPGPDGQSTASAGQKSSPGDDPSDAGANDKAFESPDEALDVDGEPVEDTVELIRHTTEAPKKRRKKKGKPGSGARQPSKHEILARLLEKNEVILDLSKKNETLRVQAKAIDDRRVRSAAEFENYRKRTQKEWELLKQQTRAEVFQDVLDVVDDFERAFSVAPEKNDDFVQGIRLIYNNLITVLENFKVYKMTALQERFDPKLHMAVAQIESDVAESGFIIEVIQDGYLQDGKVIRPAKVVIAK